MNIPKVIYQTWVNKNLPESIQDSIDNMLTINCDYEYKLYDDNEIHDYITKNFDKDIKTAYELLNVGAAKADLWRYLILYERGGIYIDIDSILYGDLNTLIHDDCAIISREKHQGVFVQWMLIYPPKHEILKLCIDECIKNIKNKISNNILYLTGPVVYSAAIKKYFNNLDIYNESDAKINLLKNSTKVKFFGVDYDGYATFKHKDCNLLYKTNNHWSSQQTIFK